MSEVARRFWAKVDVRGLEECWPWQGGMSCGRGMFRFEGKTCLASRVVYQLVYGVEPGELLVCHTCDDPVCVNPTHLWLGTNLQNMEDMRIKGRSRRHLSKLTETQVRAIKADARSGIAIATDYGVDPTTIYAIRQGRIWAHVEANPTQNLLASPCRQVGDAAILIAPEEHAAPPSLNDNPSFIRTGF